MRILIACEFSGVVRDAFIRAGHYATSCDLLDCDSPGPHYTGDVMDIIDDGWDMMIAFPPCTYLCSSGLHWNRKVPGREEKTAEAVEFVRTLLDSNIPKVAVENPVGRISTAIRPPDQKIQPWQFGEDASKQTCLWLKNLPPLESTSIVPPKGWEQVVFANDLPDCDCGEKFCPRCGVHYADCSCIGPTEDEATYYTKDGYLFGTRSSDPGKPVWGNQTPSGQNKLGPSPDRWKLRSKTYKGFAVAMAAQWGGSQ